MTSQSKGKSSAKRGGSNWTAASLEGSAIIFSVVKDAATFSPIAELKKAACVALLVLRTIQVWSRKNNVKENKEAYERLGDDSCGLIAAIWRSFKKAEDPNEWLSAEMREILEDLTHTLENICSFVQEQLSRNKAIRIIFSKSDGMKINEYREHLNYAMQKFELQSHMNINDVLLQIMRKNDQLSEQILNRNEEEEVNQTLANISREIRDREIAKRIQDEEIEKLREISELERIKQLEIDRQLEDEQSHAEELKKIEQETRDRKSELERLREAASAVEEANRLKREEEEEIAQLKRILAAREDLRSKPARKQKGSRVEEVEEEEEEWEGNFKVEEATSEEEEKQPARRISKAKRNGSKSSKRRPVLEASTEVEETSEEEEKQPARRISNAKRNGSKSSKRRPVLEASTDDDDDFQPLKTSQMRTRKLSSASLREEDLQSTRSSKIRMTHRNLSSASLRAQETEDDDTDEEHDYAPPPSRKSPKAKRKPPISPGSLPRDVNDLMAQFQGFTPMGLANPHWSGSGSPMYMPGIHSNAFIPLSPSIPYGHGAGMPGTIFNSGVGNITNTTIANVGNDNSVNKVYRSSRSQRRDVGN